MTTQPRIIIVGCGFVGLQTARLFHQAAWNVVGVTHSQDSAENLTCEPFPVIACDVTAPAAMEMHRADFNRADAVIHCASSGRGGADQYRRVYFEGMQNILRLWRPHRAVFTSSTSVYTQTDGAWVTEETPAEPERDTGKILRETEDLVLAQTGIVARLAGIYGPGRSVLLQKFLENRAVIEGDGSRMINQIHRDDAASALFFLINQSARTGIYNVCDDNPLTPLELHCWLAGHFQKPLPPFGPVDVNRKRGWTSKRVSNQKLRELGWSPQYRSFHHAIQAGAVITPQN